MMSSRTLLAALACALAAAGCGRALEPAAPSVAAVRPAAPERLALARVDEAVHVDACDVVTRRSTSDASGRKEGFAMATVRCRWSAPVRTAVASKTPAARAKRVAERERVEP